MKSKFTCPSCEQPLTAEQLIDKSWMLGCDNPRCPSDVAQKDGGAGKTQELAYRSLCNAVDNECEQLMDLEELKDLESKERDKEAMAERLGDRLDRGQ